MSEEGATAGGDKITREAVLAMVAMSLAVFVIANDFTAMSVALPDMEGELDADVSTVQWVVSAYALIFGVLIVPGGRLADMFGRVRILYVGAAVFALFSALGGLAPDIYTLIGARALQGVGGALMWPAILGLIYAILPDSKAGLAGGLVIGVAGIGNATGPLIGGALTEAASWRWILLLNVPIAAIACLVTWRTVHVANPEEHERIDYLGSVTLSVSLIALLVALTVAPDEGWDDPLVVVLLVVAAVSLASFFVREHRAGDAGLVPPSVMRHKQFLYACLSVLCMSATFFAALLYLPQFFQKILDQNPFVSGAALVPFMGVFAVASFSETWLLNRIGMKAVITIGAACMFLGPALFVAVVRDDSGYLALLPGMIVLGIGVGLFYSSITTAALTALDPSQSSLAGGIVYMFQIAGGAVGLGLTTTVFLLAANNGIAHGAADLGITLTADQTAAVRGVVAGTDTSATVVSQFPTQAAQLTEVVETSFVSGMRWGFVFDAVLALAGFAIAALAVGGPLSRFGRDVGESTDSDSDADDGDAAGAASTA